MENNYYNECIKKLYDNPEFYINEFINYKDDIYFWPKIIQMFKPRKVLEIGIGNGRLINLLHELVDIYDGIDFSSELVNYCTEKYNYRNVNIYNQDLKKSSLNDKYDLIILPFNVINNFYSEKDIADALNNIKKMCNENTIVVIDTINPKINDLIDRKEFIKTNLFYINGQLVSVFENKIFDNVNCTCIYGKRYINENGKVLKESVLPNRIFFYTELMLLLKHYGFDIIDIYGDYNFEQISNWSRKQILVIRRK